MRIAYVTPYYNGSCDGRYGRMHDWIHTARDMGDPPFNFDVLPFTVSNPDETLGYTPKQVLGDAKSLWGTKWNKVEFLLNASNIRTTLKNGKYDIVHVFPLDSIVYPTSISSKIDAPLVIGPDISGWTPVRHVPHYTKSYAQEIKHNLRYVFKNILGNLGEYDHAIAFGQHHKRILESFSIDGGKISVLEPGVARCFQCDNVLEDVDLDGTAPNILYVGDLSNHKGYPLFLRALSQLEIPFSATVVGSGNPDYELINELNIEKQITIEGFVPRHELPDIYANSDIYVVASIDETAGTNSQIEALASGTPVVVSEAPGVDEYAPNDASVTFSKREPAVLANALRTAIDNLESLTKAAQNASEEYLADRPLQQLDDIYRRLASDYST